ncbi:TonB-dependent receptor [Fulvivirga sp. M361]|uniref:TonB-dependent receptor n=1 Tax=Fulvivirga sp. M361 TaxID=2594266 RepID=UPI001179E0B0|nr:TonB-dependent receptor [Fulvivirga sp. M361]TRX62752.1 TonB-dependent receptor [Fulvivirga sp. M361]
MRNNFTLLRSSLLMLTLAVVLYSTGAFAQSAVTGHIKDENDHPLVGATVQETGTSNGTITDVNGKFSVIMLNSKAKLRISYQGFYSKEVKTDGLSNLEVILEENIWELDNMVITATRSASDIENVPQQIQVISRKEIDRTIANDVTDILKKTSGVDVIQYPGLLAGVGIRGFRPQFSGINQRTLVLIDGRPAGATNLATIDMNNIERVEVLKGPASALYGAQAMGGVVNLITKKTKGGVGGQVFGGIGNFGRVEGGFSSGGNLTDRLDYDVSFKSFTQGRDFRLGSDNLFRDRFGGDNATRILWTDTGREEVEIEDDRGDGDVRPNTTYKLYTGAIRLGYNLNDNWRIDAKMDRFYAEGVNTPGDIEDGSQRPGLKDVDRYGGDIILNGNLGENNEITAKFFATSENNTRYRVSVNDTTTVRNTFVSGDNQLKWIGVQLMDRYRIGNHFITAGIDYNRVEQDNVSFNDSGEARSVSARNPNFNQQNTGIYVQGEINLLNNRLNITAGVRNETIDYNITGTDLFPSRSESNNVINPSFGVNYQVLPNLFAHATFGTAFTTVGAFQIAGYDERSIDKNTQDGIDTVDVWIGNPDLENQESRTFDIGVRYVNEAKGFSIDLTYFNTHFDNNVINQVNPFPGTPSEDGAVIRNRNSYRNAQGTTLTGLEFDANYRISRTGLNVFANGVYIIKAEEIRDVFLQPQPLTLDMHNVADFNLNYGISYDKLSWLSAQLSGRYVGQRFDTDWSYYLGGENTTGDYADVKYPSFMVLDLMTTVSFKNNNLSLMVGNVTDENYYEKRGFNLMGRNYMLRYTLNF